MFYYPFIKVKYRSKLPKAQAIQRLAENLLPPPAFELRTTWKKWEKPYSGKLEWGHFEMNRNTNYRNSFLPIIKGSITEQMGRTIVSVQFKLHLAVLIFSCFWLGGVGFACVVITYASIRNGEFNKEGMIPYAMFLFGFALIFGGFNFECNKTHKDLQQIFDAEILDDELN